MAIAINKGTLNSSKPLLIIITGESNAGGIALNSAAKSAEIGVRSGVKILNNSTLEFENLNIGVNNLLGHVPFVQLDFTFTRHGAELQIANMVDAGLIPNPTYLCKCGQGGTNISNWDVGGSYDPIEPIPQHVEPWNYMQEKVDAAIAGVIDIEDETPQIVIFYSQGLNDISNDVPETWKTKTREHFAKIRARWSDYTIPIIMTKFPAPYTSYNGHIATICHLEQAEKLHTYFVSGDADNEGTLHWTYAGWLAMGARLVNFYRFNF